MLFGKIRKNTGRIFGTGLGIRGISSFLTCVQSFFGILMRARYTVVDEDDGERFFHKPFIMAS